MVQAKYISIRILAALLMLSALVCTAQQRFGYSQYMFNGLLVNPAYAGTDKYMNLTVQNRMQWPGSEGAPMISMASWHTPLKKSNFGLGATLGNETVGVTKSLNVEAMSSYKIKLDDKNYLSFGLQCGINHYRENLTELTVPDQYNDPTLTQNVRYTIPRFGAGIYFYNPKKIFVGLSSYSLTQSAFTKKNSSRLNEIRHYYLAAGYLIKASEKITFKPNILLKSSLGAPMNIDFNLNVLFENFLWLGVSYRYKNSFTPIAELLITKKLRIGLSYDLSTQVYGNSFRYGAPEIMINYRFVKMLPNTVISPRVF